MTNKKLPEAMLKEIIKRQGGSCHWFLKPLGEDFEFSTKYGLVFSGINHAHILEILLDPEGLRTAYGEEKTAEQIKVVPPNGNKEDAFLSYLDPQPIWELNAKYILNEWLETSSAEETISVAYDLLPDK